MVIPEGFERVREPRGFGVLRTDVSAAGCGPLWQAGEPLAGARGRGGAEVLALDAGPRAVARTYRRGGVLGRLLGERYLSPSRAMRELATLAELRSRGVECVAPVAALARRRRGSPFWRLRLLTELVPGALPLPAFLAAHPASRRRAVEGAGRLVGRAFACGLRHPDLHPDNVLARAQGGEVQLWLVDLDRAAVRPPLADRDRDRMLLRMARYLFRHAARLDSPPTAAEHLRFLRGLGWDRTRRRQRVPALARALRRAVARHRLLW